MYHRQKSRQHCQALPLSLVLLLLTMHVVRSEMFTALVELEKVLAAEKEVARDLKRYIRSEYDRLEKLERIADDYDRHSTDALQDSAKHLSNPVNAFLLVKRFTADWEKVQALIKTNASEEVLQEIYSQTESFPGTEDLSGAANALLRLQDTYNLPTEKIAKGDLQGVKESPHLSAADCFELGRQAYNERDYYHTVLWMKEALAVWGTEVHKSVSKAQILDYLAFAASMQGNVQHALNLTNEWLTLEPDHSRALNNKRYYEHMILDAQKDARKKGDEAPAEEPEFKNERPLDDYRQTDEFRRYERLCRGEETTVYKDAHKLKCRYTHRDNPMFYLAPLKEETFYLKPWIALYHDLMTDSEIEVIKQLAQPRLNRATVQNPQTGQLETAFYRISKSAWLNGKEHPLLAKVDKKSAAVIKLTLDTAEDLQVVNYGIGGHYEPHFDFARKREIGTFENWRGNRIATVIYYLTDVAAGGATVFPTIGVKVFPKKGACAVWYNLLQSGEGDYLTRHAGCPVLTGSKWVSNKWFHERGQDFARPCGLTPDE